MKYSHFSHNGHVLPIEQAVVPLGNIEYSYGFGVYETIRLANDRIYFLEEHCRRLMDSAAIISLEHGFTPEFVKKSVKKLVEKAKPEACNIKVLLVGGKT